MNPGLAAKSSPYATSVMFITESSAPLVYAWNHSYGEDHMIGYCFNPVCNRELRYLRQGSVYHWETGVGQGLHSEFFWLCPDCSSQFELIFDEEGLPLLAPSGSKRQGRRECSRIRRVLQGVLQGGLVTELPGRVDADQPQPVTL